MRIENPSTSFSPAEEFEGALNKVANSPKTFSVILAVALRASASTGPAFPPNSNPASRPAVVSV